MRTPPSIASPAAVLPLLFALASCTSTAAVPADALRAAGRKREAALRTLDGSTARLGPTTRVRFVREDGAYTPWLYAASLYTNDRGVFARRPGTGPSTDDTFEGLAWSQIRQAELRNFEGGQTVAGVAVATGFVVLVVAAASGKSSAPSPRAFVGAADTTLRVASLASSLSKTNDGGAVAPSPIDSPEGPPKDVEAGRTSAAPADLAQPSPEGARPLFSSGARRRASIRGLVGVEATVSTAYAGEVQPGAFAGARFGDFLELGGGARRIVVAPTGGAARYVAFGRAGLHGELDARRRFALPLSVDVGAGDGVELFLRINWGLRVRIYDELTLGVQPLSPALLRRGPAGPSGGSFWSAGSGLDLSWGF